MRQVGCERAECGATTFLIDEAFTLDKGWFRGPADYLKGFAPFYVCPNHEHWYTLVPMPAAVIAPPEGVTSEDRKPDVPERGDPA